MKTKFTKLLMLLCVFTFGHFAASAQCYGGLNYPGAGVVAPTTPSIPQSITTCQWAGDYNTISGLVVGSTYCIDALGTAINFITVSTSASSGAIGTGAPQYCFTATAATMYAHYNTDAACGTNSICEVTEITLQPVPLSVAFGELKAQLLEDGIQLNWNTESEINNDHFVIERSVNGVDFRPLGQIASQATHGNSSTNLDYSYMDKQPSFGENVYRIKQVDIDGQSSYSEVVSASWEKMNNPVVLFPMPFDNILKADISLVQDSRVSVRILDLSGRTVYSDNSSLQSGTQTIEMNLEQLKSGIYVVEFTAQNNVIYRQSIKKLTH